MARRIYWTSGRLPSSLLRYHLTLNLTLLLSEDHPPNGQDIPMVVVGNKVDLINREDNKPTPAEERIAEWSSAHSIPFFVTRYTYFLFEVTSCEVSVYACFLFSEHSNISYPSSSTCHQKCKDRRERWAKLLCFSPSRIAPLWCPRHGLWYLGYTRWRCHVRIATKVFLRVLLIYLFLRTDTAWRMAP